MRGEHHIKLEYPDAVLNDGEMREHEVLDKDGLIVISEQYSHRKRGPHRPWHDQTC